MKLVLLIILIGVSYELGILTSPELWGMIGGIFLAIFETVGAILSYMMEILVALFEFTMASIPVVIEFIGKIFAVIGLIFTKIWDGICFCGVWIINNVSGLYEKLVGFIQK